MRKAAAPSEPSPFEPGQRKETEVRPPAPPEPMKPQAPANLPDLIVLAQDFGFSVHGVLRVWKAGVHITDRAQIAELLAHGAPAARYKEIP